MSRQVAVLLAVAMMLFGAFVNNYLWKDRSSDRDVAVKIDKLSDRMTGIEVNVAGMVAKLDTILERAQEWITRSEFDKLDARVTRLEESD